MPKCSRTENDGQNEPGSPWIESCGNVFKDLGFDDDEAANLLARTDLMLRIRTIIEERKITQTEAAKLLKVRQPRIAEIMALKIQLFSIDTLLKYLSRLGTQVTFQYNQSDIMMPASKIADTKASYDAPPKAAIT